MTLIDFFAVFAFYNRRLCAHEVGINLSMYCQPLANILDITVNVALGFVF